MIMTVVIHHCPQCNSINIVKNGTDYKGTQKFHCHDCNAYGTINAQEHYSEDEKATILRAYRERTSMRGVERISGTARQTLARWILEQAAKLPDLADTLEDARPDDVLELDELWSFVLEKSNKQ